MTFREYVPEMAAATQVVNLGAHHAVARVLGRADGSGDRIEVYLQVNWRRPVSGPKIGATPMVVTGTHDPYLVALSIFVAAFASYTALDLGGRVSAARGFARRVWLVAAAITMGGGIWSMHFVAMLAFIMPIPMSYDIGLTPLSLVVAMVVTGGGFYVIRAFPGKAESGIPIA